MKRTTGRIARLTAVALIAVLLPVLAATTGPAAAAPTQGITGIVTESGTGVALPGTWVLAMSNTTMTLVSGTVTDSAGAYGLDLPTGDYRVEFVDPASGHATEWYDNHGFDQAVDAEVLSVLTDQTVTADAALDVPTGTITGTILEEGTGIPVADAWVTALDSSGHPAGIIRADAAGSYTIALLQPGMYRIAGMDPTGNHDVRMSPASATFNDATPLTVTAGSSVSADVTLPAVTPVPATGTITGTVTDDVSGLALPGMWVVALTASTFDFTAGAIADASGDYSLPMPDGDYFLQFFDPDRAHQFEWNANQPNPMGPGDLTAVPTGSTVDAGLAPLLGDVAGTITADADSSPIAGAWVAAFGATDGLPVAGVVADGAGAYRITGLTAGDYVVMFADRTGVHALEYHSDATSPGGATPVAVTGGNTTTVDAGLAGPT